MSRPQHGDVTKIPTPSLQQAALFINFFFPILSLIVVLLRAYSRIRTRQWGLDDWLMVAALMFALAMCGPFYMYVKLNYFGWRMVDVPVFDPAPGLWWFYLAQLFYNPVLALVKASVLVFLLRLGSHKRNIRYSIYALNTFNGLQAVAIFLVAALQCLPIAANWDAEVKATAKCVQPSFHITISAITIVTDFLVLGLPFWIFLGLKMPPAAKLAVMVVFLLGIAVTIIGIVRLVSMVKLFYIPAAPGADPYHDIGVMQNVVEVNLAIVAASGPALRPLFRSMLPKLFGGISDKYSGNKPTKMSYGNDYANGTTRQVTATGGIALKSLRGGGSRSHTECRSASPSGSEEEIMTYNGILRTTQVKMNFEDNVSSDSRMEAQESKDPHSGLRFHD
ncbi:related to integral membrane protein PTH11 [Cephalotrichum gorgonifer]|uniref:Related to integral membrane protein PTH11 n=1 Tax=Cephalotrichum gorgonifer TaxID=2041049 RepID=A0AAE8SUT0_9PEZI|nr:related to integral membrane protein PTH11 [Cephalotrichum gorgonifer]